MGSTNENTTEANRKRYECNLEPTLLNKAVKVLGEPACNIQRLAAIDELQAAFAETAIGSELGGVDDSLLLRFLRAEKFDKAEALAHMEYYHRERREWRWVLDKVDNPRRVSSTMLAGCVAQLPGPARDGSTAAFYRLGKQSDARIEDVIACLVLITEKLSEDEATQIGGITIIVDLLALDFALARQAAMAVIRRIIALIQRGIPMRVKGVHFVNEPVIFTLIASLGKPFLNDKVRRKLHTHGSDFSRLQQFVDKDLLPRDYLGEGPQLDSQNRADWFLGEHN